MAGDCQDHDPAIIPGTQEICDGKNNDCDGWKDEEFGLKAIEGTVKPAATVDVASDKLGARIWTFTTRIGFLVKIVAFIHNKKIKY